MQYLRSECSFSFWSSVYYTRNWGNGKTFLGLSFFFFTLNYMRELQQTESEREEMVVQYAFAFLELKASRRAIQFGPPSPFCGGLFTVASTKCRQYYLLGNILTFYADSYMHICEKPFWWQSASIFYLFVYLVCVSIQIKKKRKKNKEEGKCMVILNRIGKSTLIVFAIERITFVSLANVE